MRGDHVGCALLASGAGRLCGKGVTPSMHVDQISLVDESYQESEVGRRTSDVRRFLGTRFGVLQDGPFAIDRGRFETRAPQRLMQPV